jgi:hypothetical protein
VPETASLKTVAAEAATAGLTAARSGATGTFG